MVSFNKTIITDDQQRPIAVQVDYATWLEIERILQERRGVQPGTDLNRLAGKLRLDEDPLLKQRRLRDEWR